MGWEQGLGLFKNIGNVLGGIGSGGGGFMGNFGTGSGLLSQIGQGGEGFMGKFGTGGGLLSGIGQGGDRFGGKFGTGEGKMSEMFGGQQDVTGQEAPADYNQGLVDTYNAQFQDAGAGSDDLLQKYGIAEGGDITNLIKNLSQGDSISPVSQPYEVSSPVAPILQESTEVANPDEFLEDSPVYGAENQGVKDYNAQFEASGEGSDVVGPGSLHQMIARVGEGGSRHAMRQDIDPLLEGEGLDKTKGFFGSAWDKLGGIKGIMETALGGGQGKMGDEGVLKAAGIEQPEYNPLQLYGGGTGGGGSWADVTGSNYLQGAQFSPLSQGLAGYYNPQLRELR